MDTIFYYLKYVCMCTYMVCLCMCVCMCKYVCVCSTICLFINYLHTIPFVSYSIVFIAVFNLVLASSGLTQ